jgi:hypothetical protein
MLAALAGFGFWVLGFGERVPRTQHPAPNTPYPTPVRRRRK